MLLLSPGSEGKDTDRDLLLPLLDGHLRTAHKTTSPTCLLEHCGHTTFLLASHYELSHDECRILASQFPTRLLLLLFVNRLDDQVASSRSKKRSVEKRTKQLFWALDIGDDHQHHNNNHHVHQLAFPFPNLTH